MRLSFSHSLSSPPLPLLRSTKARTDILGIMNFRVSVSLLRACDTSDRRQAVETTLHLARLSHANGHSNLPSTSSPSSSYEPSRPLSPTSPSDDSHPAAQAPAGWKLRTVLVGNIPPDMRDRACLEGYFERGLGEVLEKRRRKSAERERKSGEVLRRWGTGEVDREREKVEEDEEEKEEGVVEEVVVVRRLLELSKLRERRFEVLQSLEEAHVQLGRNVLFALKRWRVREGVSGKEGEGGSEGEKELLEGLTGESQGWTETERMRFLEGKLGRFLDLEEDGFWLALYEIPRPLLDEFQPLRYGPLSLAVLIRRKPNVYLIDYLSAKLALLSTFIDDALSSPLDEFAPSSSAFVTFRSPELARLAVKKMGGLRKGKGILSCDVSMAPDYRDLEWVRLFPLFSFFFPSFLALLSPFWEPIN